MIWLLAAAGSVYPTDLAGTGLQLSQTLGLMKVVAGQLPGLEAIDWLPNCGC